jgi:class 3 adenylate cyclase
VASEVRSDADFFREAEADSGNPLAPEPSDWRSGLLAAHARELAFDLKGARAALDAFAPPEPWAVRIAELIRFRTVVREATPDGLNAVVHTLGALRAKVESMGEHATHARAEHLMGTTLIRLGRLELAEVALGNALEHADVEAKAGHRTALIRIADTLGQLLIGQGAWAEAARTLMALAARRRADGDRVGVAISGGHLVRLHVSLGEPLAGAALAEEILGLLDDSVPAMTRLRMRTLLVTALVEVPGDARLPGATDALETLVRAATNDAHYLRGYACLSLARARAALGGDPKPWFAEAAERFKLPVHRSLLRYYEAKIDPALMAAPDWLAGQESLWNQVDFVSEAEIESRLLHARTSKTPNELRDRLERAYARAKDSNNPTWMRWLDEASAELDPALFSERLALRYAGRGLAELSRTAREDATIIFADLVGFTPKSLTMPPEEVMDTVRGLFELGVPLLAKYKVQPLTYMGDGLLAIAQGPGHAQRGVEFARALVARCGRVTKVRKILESGVDLSLRAGVASGTVVLGSLGTLFKTEFAAIGTTTNLAARLQAKAEPGEVMCARDTALAAGVSDGKDESLELKGYGASLVPASRIIVT